MKRFIGLSMMLIFTIMLAACGTESNMLSPQEVVNSVLQESNEPISYYGEYTLSIGDGSADSIGKEWVTEDKKYRIEMISEDGEEEIIGVNDGKSVSMYDKASHTVMVMEVDESEINDQSPRQQAERMLGVVKDSHDLSAGTEEEIAGRSTYHIIAKEKGNKSLLGDIDIWVDKETWLPLKTVANSGGNTLTLTYTKIDYKTKLDEDLFVLEVPEGATVEVMDEESYAPQEVVLNDVKETLGSFYQLAEIDGIELAEITALEGIEEDRLEYSFEYLKDGMAAFSVTVFQDLPNTVDFGGIGEEEEITIRGKKAIKMEMGEFRLLEWSEDGLKYVVLIENPEIEFEDMAQYLEEMELVE